jgi:hypothetical protein
VGEEANHPVMCELCKKVVEEVKKSTKEALDKVCDFRAVLRSTRTSGLKCS